MLVAQSVAHRRQLHRRHRVEEARRQTAKTAIAQTRVRLLVKDLPPLAALKTPPDDRIEHEVQDVIAERAADEKLDRDIVDPLWILARVGLVRLKPTLRKNVSHRAGGGLVALSRVGGLELDDIVELHAPLIEGVRRSGEGRRADAVLLQQFVGVE